MKNDDRSSDMPSEVTQEQHTKVLLAIAEVGNRVSLNSQQNVEIIRRLDMVNGSVAKLFRKDDELQRELMEHPGKCPVAEDVKEVRREQTHVANQLEEWKLDQAERRGEQTQRNKIVKGLQPAIHYAVIAIIVLILSQGPNIVHFFFPHMGVRQP